MTTPVKLSRCLVVLACWGIGCAEATPPAAAPTTPPPAAVTQGAPPPAPAPPLASAPPPTAAAAPAPPKLSPPIDEKVVAESTGVEKPEKAADGSVKVSFPRKDVEVAVDGWKMPPFMGLTSWAAFAPGREGVAEAMVMGDLVLFEDEVNPVMSQLLENGVQVTALHNHFFYDTPNAYFMHIEGEGTTAALGKGVRAALDAGKAVRARSAQPRDRFEGGPIPAKSAVDPAKVEAAFGVKGAAKDGMVKVVIGRPAAAAACGCKIGKAMGVNTWAAFAGTDDDAVVDGDFAMTEDELQPVLKSLRGSGINVVAIHHHMVGETPRILFLHYWGRGPAAQLARGLKSALDAQAGAEKVRR